MNDTQRPYIFEKPRQLWFERHPASRSWLALGVLLAAWNAVDNDISCALRQRPPALRKYTAISVRAVARLSAASDVGASPLK